jgi:hypothetical protein
MYSLIKRSFAKTQLFLLFQVLHEDTDIATMALIMSQVPIPFDISSNKDLLRLAEEVKTTKTPRALTKDDETVAVLVPVEKAGKPASIQEALALAGAWSDLPSEHMEEELDRIRHESKPTPPFHPDFS